MANLSLNTINESRIFEKCKRKHKSHVFFSGKESEISYDFKAIMFYIQKNKTNIAYLKQIRQYCYGDELGDDSEEITYVLDNGKDVKVNDNIMIHMKI